MMKKNLKRNLTATICLVLLAGLMVFFFVRLNKIEKLAVKVQESAFKDSATISQVVNFFNASLAPQQ